uniref:PduL/EutD family phosphate acyltransferase n=1 Tax=Gordoniibacillus kamchatkensis TaxID=1590651 RepID=UPI000AC3BA80
MALITETQLRAQSVKGKGIPNPFPVAKEDKLTPAAADFLKSRGIALSRTGAEAAAMQARTGDPGPAIPVGVSGRHVHLSDEHVAALFGAGYRLTPLRELSQKGQFAAKETVTLVGPKGVIPHVRILGPSRGATQAEISRTDGYTLGVHPPVRLSGNIAGTPGITIAGELGAIVLSEG